jgi:acyl-CoA thioester hydrolase
MKPLPRDLHSTTVIRFQDCDPFGHLNNARYIDYFINTRQDQLAANYDFHIMEFGKQPSESWVVSKSQIAYLAPAYLMETVSIHTRLIHLTDRQLVVEGLMLDEAERRLKAVCWMEFTYVSLQTGKSVPHPDDIAAFLGSVVFEDAPADLDFDVRVQHLKMLYRKAKETELINAAALP